MNNPAQAEPGRGIPFRTLLQALYVLRDGFDLIVGQTAYRLLMRHLAGIIPLAEKRDNVIFAQLGGF
jgi:hypothetical protein